MPDFLAALMSPGRIGTMEVRNRIVHAPMSLSLGEGDGTCGKRFLAYYEARARGGVGGESQRCSAIDQAHVNVIVVLVRPVPGKGDLLAVRR